MIVCDGGALSLSLSLINQGKSTRIELSNQPIILFIAAKDCTDNQLLAYWPNDAQVACRLLGLFKDCLNAHQEVGLVDMLMAITAGDLTDTSDRTGDPRRRAVLREYLKIESLSQIGILGGVVHRDEYAAAVCKTSKAFIVNESELAPHLYHQQCYSYY